VGGVNLVQRAGKGGDFYPIDERVYAPDVEGKTKTDHFQEMCGNALALKQGQARPRLCASWDASAENVKRIPRRQCRFFPTRKRKRLVRLSKAPGSIHLAEVEWTPARLAHGVLVKLKVVPLQGRLFKLGAPEGDSDWIVCFRQARVTIAA
jgi:hypothetical protein